MSRRSGATLHVSRARTVTLAYQVAAQLGVPGMAPTAAAFAEVGYPIEGRAAAFAREADELLQASATALSARRWLAGTLVERHQVLAAVRAWFPGLRARVHLAFVEGQAEAAALRRDLSRLGRLHDTRAALLRHLDGARKALTVAGPGWADALATLEAYAARLAAADAQVAADTQAFRDAAREADRLKVALRRELTRLRAVWALLLELHPGQFFPMALRPIHELGIVQVRRRARWKRRVEAVGFFEAPTLPTDPGPVGGVAEGAEEQGAAAGAEGESASAG